jgi:hypothetical protein
LCSLTRRVWTQYFLRDFGPVTLFLLFGTVLLAWSVVFGGMSWLHSEFSGTPATAGTVMLSALPFLMGFQMMLQAVVLDMNKEAKAPLPRPEALGQEPAPAKLVA